MHFSLQVTDDVQTQYAQGQAALPGYFAGWLVTFAGTGDVNQAGVGPIVRLRRRLCNVFRRKSEHTIFDASGFDAGASVLIQADQWWPSIFPALAIGSLVIAINLIADSLDKVAKA